MNLEANSDTSSAQWAVLGAGAGGMAVVGKLLDEGIPQKKLLWIDNKFDVGRLGESYYNVPGNSKAAAFQKFVLSCDVFKEATSSSLDALVKLDPTSEPVLSTVIDPLRDITKHLLTKVTGIKDSVVSLHYDGKLWHIKLQNGNTLHAQNLVLATGCQPRVLEYDIENLIPLDNALDKPTLTNLVDANDTVAVVGSAHSAVLLMMFLHELGVKKIVNFYLNPFKYGNDMGNHNKTSITGLLGVASRWAFNNLEQNLPENIVRVYNNEEARAEWLPQCDKIIYAVGYKRNDIPNFNAHTLAYDSNMGTIAPHLYGIGLAFPQEVPDHDGSKAYSIGIINFMNYAQQVVPHWIAQDELPLPHKQEKIFSICMY